MANFVYIGTSLDGYIADKNGALDWLNCVPNPNNDDFGWSNFIDGIDALVMGRNTFETVCNFDVPWPYSKPVFVLSNSLSEIPQQYRNKAELISGPLKQVVSSLNSKGFNNLYIDGGKTIQSFFQENLIDEMTITTLPILLGGGVSLFGELDQSIEFELIHSEVLLSTIVKNHYRRKT